MLARVFWTSPNSRKSCRLFLSTGLATALGLGNKEAVESKWKVDSGEKIEALGAWLIGQTDSRAEFIGTAIKSWLAEKNWGIGSVMPLVRIALTGGLTGPDIFETIALLGLEESRKRIEAFHRQMQKWNKALP